MLFFCDMDRLAVIRNKILDGGSVGRDDMDALLREGFDKERLFETAAEITREMAPRHFDRCSIINAKSGLCSENCKWCAQSARYKTSAEIYPLLDKETCLKRARFNEEQRIERFSIVTSGKKPNREQIRQIAEIAAYIKEHSSIRLCASLGLLSGEELAIIRESGVERYHCNLEAAPSFFSELCTTHTVEDKVRTLKAAREAGMDICSGGIIGMGESMMQRVELAFAVRDLGVKSIPLNILQPIKGTPLQDMPPLGSEEIFVTIALFRLVNPDAYLRFAGGRASLSDEDTEKAFEIGINSAIMGHMLTTDGAEIRRDMEMIEKKGYEL